MLLYYQQAVHGNFGDALNGWLWQRLLPGMWDDDGVVFVGIGTLIDRAIPDARLRVIFGSGAGYAAPPQGVAESDGGWRVYGVRGPLTARVLGLHPSLALTDTAILLSQLAEFKESRGKGTVFVPHWKSVRFGAWQEICDDLGIEFVNPCDDSQAVIRRIARAGRVIAESMHAAIVADAFRVPWSPVVLSREVSPFKWADWAQSLEMAYRPYCLPPSTRAEAMRDQVLRWTVFENIYGFPSADRLRDPQVLRFEDIDKLVDDFWRGCARTDTPGRALSSRLIEAGFKRLSRGVVRQRSRRGGERLRDRARDGLTQVMAQPAMLSADHAHRRALGRTLDALEALKSDWAGSFAGARH